MRRACSWKLTVFHLLMSTIADGMEDLMDTTPMDIGPDAIEKPPLGVSEDIESDHEDEEDEAVDLDNEPDIAENDEPDAEADPSEIRNDHDHPVKLGKQKLKRETCPLDVPIAQVRRIVKSAVPTRRLTAEFLSALSRSAGAFALYLLAVSQDATSIRGKQTSMSPIHFLYILIPVTALDVIRGQEQ